MDSNEFVSKYGPWALVTGASSGIGLALAHQLAELGLSIVLVARRQATLEQHAQDLMNRFGAETRIVALDLASEGAVDRSSRRQAILTSVSWLRPRASVLPADLSENDIGEELGMIRVNCMAVAELTHVFARRLDSTRARRYRTAELAGRVRRVRPRSRW